MSKTKANYRRDKLVGKWFHTFDENGKVEYQGEICDSIARKPGYYLVELYEWISGGPSCYKVVHIDNMDGWSFYDSADHMNRCYDHKLTTSAKFKG